MGAPAGRRLLPRADDRPRLTAEWLRRRYVAQRRSAQEIATETGWSSQYVRDRLRDHGIPLRPRGAAASFPPVDAAALAGWSAQGLSLAQIAARTGYSPSGVRKLLHRAGLPSRAAGPVKSSPDPAELAEVVRLYRDEGRSLAAVGGAFGHGPDWAKARVHAAGLTVRPGGTPRTELDLEQLRRWRLDEGLPLDEIATRAGRSATTVAAALHRAGVRRPTRPPLDPAVLRQLYVEERRTLGQVAAALGVSDRRVRAAMVAAGIPLRPARRRADLAALPTLSRAQLTELYLRQRLTTSEIAARYGGSENWVRTALAAHAIGRRTGGARPVPPVDLDAATLTDLYVTRQARRPGDRRPARGAHLAGDHPPARTPRHPPARATAASRPAASTARHRAAAALSGRAATHRGHRRPVRHRPEDGPALAAGRGHRGPTPHRPRTPPSPRRRRAPRALPGPAVDRGRDRRPPRHHHPAGAPDVARRRRPGPPRRHPAPPPTTGGDPALGGALRRPRSHRRTPRHRVPRRPRPGDIASRFPSPVPLTAQLLAALYAETGLSARQIELLTGQPHEQILDALHRAGIPVRRPTGSSPWLTRLREHGGPSRGP